MCAIIVISIYIYCSGRVWRRGQPADLYSDKFRVLGYRLFRVKWMGGTGHRLGHYYYS